MGDQVVHYIPYYNFYKIRWYIRFLSWLSSRIFLRKHPVLSARRGHICILQAGLNPRTSAQRHQPSPVSKVRRSKQRVACYRYSSDRACRAQLLKFWSKVMYVVVVDLSTDSVMWVATGSYRYRTRRVSSTQVRSIQRIIMMLVVSACTGACTYMHRHNTCM